MHSFSDAPESTHDDFETAFVAESPSLSSLTSNQSKCCDIFVLFEHLKCIDFFLAGDAAETPRKRAGKWGQGGGEEAVKGVGQSRDTAKACWHAQWRPARPGWPVPAAKLGKN